MKKHGKKYISNLKKIDKNKSYSILECCQIIKQLDHKKFDETIDIVLNLSGKNKKNFQISGFLKLPYGNNEKIKLAVFTKKDKSKIMEKYKIELVGNEDLAEKIKKNKNIKIDKVISSPDTMTTVSKLGKILGPRGLMPNPKMGTVVHDIEKAILDSKTGIASIKTDKNFIVHTTAGSLKLTENQLSKNISAVIRYVKNISTLENKGQYIKKITISSTMGPSININTMEI